MSGWTLRHIRLKILRSRSKVRTHIYHILKFGVASYHQSLKISRNDNLCVRKPTSTGPIKIISCTTDSTGKGPRRFPVSVEIRRLVIEKMSMEQKTMKSSTGCPSEYPMSISAQYSHGINILSNKSLNG